MVSCGPQPQFVLCIHPTHSVVRTVVLRTVGSHHTRAQAQAEAQAQSQSRARAYRYGHGHGHRHRHKLDACPLSPTDSVTLRRRLPCHSAALHAERPSAVTLHCAQPSRRSPVTTMLHRMRMRIRIGIGIVVATLEVSTAAESRQLGLRAHHGPLA